MADGAQPPREDVRLWIGTVAAGREAEHEQLVEWLGGPEAAEVFRRRRLTEYALFQSGTEVTVAFKAPHTGDPRIMIDFLRYPGVWPEFWQFARAGGAAELAGIVLSTRRVHWQKAESEHP